VKIAHGFGEIGYSEGTQGQRDNRYTKPLTRARYESDFVFLNTNRFSMDIDTVKTNARDMFQSGRGVDARLVKRTINDP
jgi:type IV secretory pathway VirB10-like protein